MNDAENARSPVKPSDNRSQYSDIDGSRRLAVAAKQIFGTRSQGGSNGKILR
jgi:hypothetical protein